MKRDRLAMEARHALVHDEGMVGVSSARGVVTGLPFLVVGARRQDDPFTTARQNIRESKRPDTCVVLAPRNARHRDDLGVYVPMPLWAAMVAAYIRETERRDDGSAAHRR